MSTPLRPRLLALTAAACSVAFAFVVASCGSQRGGPASPSSVADLGQSEAKGGATGRCADGGIKDSDAPYTATAPAGEVVMAVCVKAGTSTISVSPGNSCYTLAGLGTETATVVKSGSGSSCKDISYVTFYTGAPTPIPTPTSTPTPTVGTLPTPTPTPTVGALPTPTPTPTVGALPTPTPTPTVGALPTPTRTAGFLVP